MANVLMINRSTLTTTTTWLTLFTSLSLYYSFHPSSSCMSLFLFLFVLSIAALLVIAVRATVVAWITVLALLAFAGKRRKSLVRDGGKITTDVTMYVLNIMLKERRLIAVVFAVLSVMVHFHRADSA